MGGQGDTDRVSGNLFIPEAMPRREAQFAPGELAQAIEGVSKGRLLPLLARGKAIPATVEIAEGKERRGVVWWFVRGVGNLEASPLSRRGTFDAPTRAHTITCLLK
jgi:hypothetical protein